MRLLGFLAPTLLRSSTTSHHRAQARAGASSYSIANRFTGLGHPARFKSALSHAIQLVWRPSINRCVLWHYVSAFMPFTRATECFRVSLSRATGPVHSLVAYLQNPPWHCRGLDGRQWVWPSFFISPVGLGIFCASSGAERLWFGRHFGKSTILKPD